MGIESVDVIQTYIRGLANVGTGLSQDGGIEVRRLLPARRR